MAARTSKTTAPKDEPAKTEAPAGPASYDTFEACLDDALTRVEKPGLALEFGVSTGGSLRRIADGMPDGSRVVGFDSFAGLPEHWREGFPAGSFRATPPDIPGTELVVGLYADSLPGWVSSAAQEGGPGDVPVRLVHIDCDLYSSTRDVLANIGPLLEPGCLIVFDEYHGYPGAEGAHEQRAWLEWVEATGAQWAVLAEGPEQLLVRLDETVQPEPTEPTEQA